MSKVRPISGKMTAAPWCVLGGMPRRFFAWTLLSAALIGCATQANYVRYLDEWRGEPLLRLYTVMGYPTSEEKFSDGVSRLRYKSDNSYINPPTWNTYTVDRTPYSDYSPGYWVPRVCTTDFFVDKTGHVTRWEINGNDCSMTEGRLKESLHAMGRPVPEK